MFVSPVSIMLLFIASIPFITNSVLTNVYDIVVDYFPRSEYYLLNGIWLLTKIYTQCQRRSVNIYSCIERNIIGKSDQTVIFVRNGYVINKSSIGGLNKCKRLEHDMVLQEIYDTSEDFKTCVIRHNTVDTISDNFVKSNISLLGTTVKIMENGYLVLSKEIDFGKDNYYIVGNILFDRQFVKYWLCRYHGIQVTDTQSYEISFFDNKIRPHLLYEPSYIEVCNDCFNITNNEGKNDKCMSNIISENNDDINNHINDVKFDTELDNEWTVTGSYDDEFNEDKSHEPEDISQPNDISGAQDEATECSDEVASVNDFENGNIYLSFFRGKLDWSKFMRNENN